MSGIELGAIGGMTASAATAAGTPWLAGFTITLGDAIMAATTLASVGGSLSQGDQYQAYGEQQRQIAEWESRQAEVNAGQERAASQHQALEERRRARLVGSRARAVAGASGAGAMDPDVINLLGDIEQEGRYRSELVMAEGENRAKGLESQAVANRMSADLARRNALDRAANYRRSAGMTLLEGAGDIGMRVYDRKDRRTMFEKYGRGGYG